MENNRILNRIIFINTDYMNIAPLGLMNGFGHLHFLAGEAVENF